MTTTCKCTQPRRFVCLSNKKRAPFVCEVCGGAMTQKVVDNQCAMTTTAPLPFDLFDPDTWPEPETPAENRQAAEALIDEPEPVIIPTKAGPQYAFGALLARPDGAGTQMSLI